MRIRTFPVFLFLLIAGSVGANPLEDDGFSSATPPPDVDLVVVREKAYGAGGVDLSAYGLGNPDCGQSISFRMFADTNSSLVYS